jgi:hypothetical protein
MERFFDRIFGHTPAYATDFLKGKEDVITYAQSNTTYRWIMYALNLFGDPLQIIHVPYPHGVEEKYPLSSGYLNTSARPVILSPNPFYNSLIMRINLVNPGELTIQLFDVAGRKCFSKAVKYEPEKNLFDLKEITQKELPCGVYFLKIITSEGTQLIEKIVKVK